MSNSNIVQLWKFFVKDIIEIRVKQTAIFFFILLDGTHQEFN